MKSIIGALRLEMPQAFLMPELEAGLMEQEGPMVGHVNLVLDVRLAGGQVAGVALLAAAVAGPHFDRRVLRKETSRHLAPDDGADVVAPLPPQFILRDI